MANFAMIALRLIEDAVRWVVSLFRSTKLPEAENLFLRRQLALYMERGVKPRRIDAATRVSLAVLSKLFDWRSSLVVVQPATPDSLAPRRLAVAVATEVKIRSATDPKGTARADPPDGQREPSVGRGADRQRVAAQVGPSDFAENRAQYIPKRQRGQLRGDQLW
jgi:hypothetical protein